MGDDVEGAGTTADGDADVNAATTAGAADGAAFNEDPTLHKAWVQLEDEHTTLYARQYIVAMQYRHQYDQYAKRGGAGDFPSYMRAIDDKASGEGVSEARANKISAMGKARIELFREDYDAVLELEMAHIDLDAGHSQFDAEVASTNLDEYLTKKGWPTATEVDAAYHAR